MRDKQPYQTRCVDIDLKRSTIHEFISPTSHPRDLHAHQNHVSLSNDHANNPPSFLRSIRQELVLIFFFFFGKKYLILQ